MVMIDLAAPPAQSPRPTITRVCPACATSEQTVRGPGDPVEAATILLACAHCPVDGPFIVYLDAHERQVHP